MTANGTTIAIITTMMTAMEMARSHARLAAGFLRAIFQGIQRKFQMKSREGEEAVKDIKTVKFGCKAAKFENQKYHDKRPQAKATLKIAPGLGPSP
jgi:hypothetical protein